MQDEVAGMRNAFKIVFGKCLEKRLRGRSGNNWEDNTKNEYVVKMWTGFSCLG